MLRSSKWFDGSVFYEIYVPSFQDSNNDGIGDLNGITARLNYLKELGVDAIWLTPFFESPKIDNGYDISNYTAVDKDFGTIQDFKNLIKVANELNIKVIIDIVLNHTSNLHPWFLESLNPDSLKRDYYIWNNKIPNNFESFFGGSAYELINGAYYYHSFAKEQVDLNWTNDLVFKEFLKIFEFWCDLGVSGFRLDVINFLTTDLTVFQENNEKEKQIDQNGIFTLINKITTHLKKIDSDLFIIGEVGSEELTTLEKYYSQTKMDVVFNFNLGSIQEFDLNNFLENLNKTLKVMKPTLFFSSHDMRRSLSRLFENDIEKFKALIGIQMLSLGYPFIYYGEEIGLEDVSITKISDLYDIQAQTEFKITKDLKKALLKSRDFSRGTMQWDSTLNYGFSKKTPWLKLKAQKSLKKDLFLFYKKLIECRDDVLKHGKMSEVVNIQDVIFFNRKLGSITYEIIINFSDTTYFLKPQKKIIFQEKYNETIKPYGFIVYERNEDEN